MVKKKIQLHGSSGKCKSLPKATTPVASTSAGTSTVLDGDPNSELAQKFELELCWCIQQLQTSLKNGKLNAKQMEEQQKVLNTLMSTSAPIIKKRQVMRMTFGDYRAKMEAENKKFQTQSNANRIKVTTATPSKNSMFLRKSIFAKSGKDFKFNFPTPNNDVPDVSTISISEEHKENGIMDKINKEITGNFNYVPSNNEFKFNFDITES